MENIKEMNRKGQISFRTLAISALLVGIFALSIVSFGVQFQSENSVNESSLLSNEPINRSYTNIQTELNDSVSSIDLQRDSFFSDVPIIGEITLILGAITGVGRVVFGSLTSLYDITFVLVAETIGVSPLALSVITAIIILSGIILTWRLLRSGN